jgi:hypothetical protein
MRVFMQREFGQDYISVLPGLKRDRILSGNMVNRSFA